MTSETNNQSEDVRQQGQTRELNQPNEAGSIHVDGFIKIFDPVSHEVLLETRA